MSIADANHSSSHWAYYRLLIPIKIMRFGTEYGEKLGRAVGELPKLAKPVSKLKIPSRSGRGRTIRVHVHKNAAALGSEKPTAVHLNWHGSGWILPGLGSDSEFIRQTLRHPSMTSYPLTILDCDYAKSPEYPCPMDAEDARDVYDYVLQNPDLYDPNKITVGGFSAGGSIALGLSVEVGHEARMRARSEGVPDEKFVHPIRAVFSVYPVATWEGPREVVRVPKEVKELPGMVLPLWFSKYITNAHLFPPKRNTGLSWEEEKRRKEELVHRPIVSTLNADPEDFSPIVTIYTAQYDHLMRGAEELRTKLKEESRVRVFGRKVMGVGHGWDQLVKKGQFGYAERDETYDGGARLIAMAGDVEV
ncbi:hypothetical protein FRC19_007149 [Serendipita sp. 401]|nr:hypothetical protein FRC19_007149 [Serendipita sp. 401]